MRTPDAHARAMRRYGFDQRTFAARVKQALAGSLSAGDRTPAITLPPLPRIYGGGPVRYEAGRIVVGEAR